MTTEEKQLLLKDLCARLPYGVKCRIRRIDDFTEEILAPIDIEFTLYNDSLIESWAECKPYLRPMSSMTKEEAEEASSISRIKYFPHVGRWFKWGCINDAFVDWLNAHYFDYRGLIEKGLALEAPADMYKTE